MKESIRAAEHELAHNRCVAALKNLAGEDDPKIAELEDLKARRLPPAVAAMMEMQIMADILEGLSSPASIEASVAALREASDEDLLAVDGIGKVGLKKIREAVG